MTFSSSVRRHPPHWQQITCAGCIDSPNTSQEVAAGYQGSPARKRGPTKEGVASRMPLTILLRVESAVRGQKHASGLSSFTTGHSMSSSSPDLLCPLPGGPAQRWLSKFQTYLLQVSEVFLAKLCSFERGCGRGIFEACVPSQKLN